MIHVVLHCCCRLTTIVCYLFAKADCMLFSSRLHINPMATCMADNDAAGFANFLFEACPCTTNQPSASITAINFVQLMRLLLPRSYAQAPLRLLLHDCYIIATAIIRASRIVLVMTTNATTLTITSNIASANACMSANINTISTTMVTCIIRTATAKLLLSDLLLRRLPHPLSLPLQKPQRRWIRKHHRHRVIATVQTASPPPY